MVNIYKISVLLSLFFSLTWVNQSSASAAERRHSDSSLLRARHGSHSSLSSFVMVPDGGEYDEISDVEDIKAEEELDSIKKRQKVLEKRQRDLEEKKRNPRHYGFKKTISAFSSLSKHMKATGQLDSDEEEELSLFLEGPDKRQTKAARTIQRAFRHHHRHTPHHHAPRKASPQPHGAPSAGFAPPPPPPPMPGLPTSASVVTPLPKVEGNRADLLAQIRDRNGSSLRRSSSPQPQTDGRMNLMAAIRKGKPLRKTGEATPAQKTAPKKTPRPQDLAASISASITRRQEAMKGGRSSDSEPESEEADWDD